MSVKSKLQQKQMIALLVAGLWPVMGQAEHHHQLADIAVEASAIVRNSPYWHAPDHMVNGFGLTQRQAATLGETLNKTPGVQSGYFGPNSSQPVIRSLSGARVQILHNGMAVADMAGISANLPTAVEPMLADGISVSNGTDAVLYGGRAIGGSVNVHDGRIPQQLPAKMIQGKFNLRGGHNSGNTQAFRLDGSNGHNWAWHIDGLRREVSSIRIPGNAKPALCYDENLIYTSGAYAGVDSTLKELCQVNAELRREINPAYFPYLSKFYLDLTPDERKDYGLSEADKFTTRPGYSWSPNPPNPDYVAGTQNDRILVKSPISDIVPLQHGRMPNGYARQHEFALGSSYIGEGGYMGVAVSRYLNRYGVPGFAAVGTDSGQKANAFLPANIRASQTRLAVDGAWQPSLPGLKGVRVQWTHTRADNAEYLGDVLSGSLNSQSQQWRVEAHSQTASAGPIRINGSMGVDIRHRKIRGQGQDRYLPDIDTQEHGVFLIQKNQWAPWTLTLGARWGQVKHSPIHSDYIPAKDADQDWQARQFGLHQYHATLRFEPTDYGYSQLQYGLSQRAPEANELYAGKRHYAIWADERGQQTLNKETAYSWEWRNGIELGNTRAQASLYRTRFKDYLYLLNTGFSRPILPVKRWEQRDYQIDGMELELSQHIPTRHWGAWDVRVFADQVKSRPVGDGGDDGFSDRYTGQYLPSLPVSRYGLGLDWHHGRWVAGSSLTRYQAPKHRGNYFRSSKEPDLGGYTLWDAYLGYRQPWHGLTVEWYLDGRNLGNVEARAHQSVLKYLTPLPGRAVTAGVRMDF